MTPLDTGLFFREYTSRDAVLKYTRATAGFGISYLLDHDYKQIYLSALRLLPAEVRHQGIRILEFGCGGGMNLVHLVSLLRREGIDVSRAVGTDFSPVLIEAAKREARSYLRQHDRRKVDFYVAKNETLIGNLSEVTGQARSELENSFHLILGVNTIRYCHRAKTELDCAQDISRLLAPRGICVAIDMNNRFPLFRSVLRDPLRRNRGREYYLPSLEEYAAPFAKAGLAIVRKEHFCWIPHSSGAVLCSLLSTVRPVLDAVVKSRAMRSLVVARKPAPRASSTVDAQAGGP
jgi:SAM-dependent methyltransferase